MAKTERLTREEIGAIEARAKAATQGRWKVRGPLGMGWWLTRDGDSDENFQIAAFYGGRSNSQGCENAMFAEAASPEQVLKLCAMAKQRLRD